MHQKEYWNSHKKRRDPHHPVIRAFVIPKLKLLYEIIRKHKTDSPVQSVIDIGCGNGYFTYYFEKLYSTTALDFSLSMLQINKTATRICASADGLPMRDNSFDIAFCSNLLHHMSDPNPAIIEMKRISRRFVVISEPNRNNPFMLLFGLWKKEERGTIRYSKKYIEKLLQNNRLKILHKTTIGAILPNKTPIFLLPVLKQIDGEFPCAFYNLIIAEKEITAGMSND